jgi:uroporphyrinogen decarboxylase
MISPSDATEVRCETFLPDYSHMLDVLANRRPRRLPIYEHIIDPSIMEAILGEQFAGLATGGPADRGEFFRQYCRFFKKMTYDTVSFEMTVVDQLPDHGAIYGGRPGPIQNRADFDRYPWNELATRYWAAAEPMFQSLVPQIPPGMKALGGVGNGIFEISEDLVGFERLAYLQADDPELFAEVYVKIGDLMVELWTTFLERYSDAFAICRFGDDLGFKTSTLVSPSVIRQHVLPQYRRVIGLIKAAGKPFLWHSCGCIFPVMDDVIALGIDAKHSNEDCIARYERWIELYGGRIGLLGGIDLDILCQKKPEEVYQIVLERGRIYRRTANGYALGTGNSVPDYVPVEGYLAMIRAAKQLRAEEEA